MTKEFESVKDFSKDKQQEERKKVAESIRAQKKEYFSKKENMQKRMGELVAAAEAKKLQAAEVRGEIEGAEDEILSKSQNFLRRLLERRKIKELESKVGQAKVSEETIAQELGDLETALADLEQSRNDRSALDNARAELRNFYQKSEQAWNEYEEDREEGDIKKVTRDRGTIIVHAFMNPVTSPSDENGIIRKELGWQKKLDLLVLEPTISTSAVDENHQVTFGSVGALIGSGRILRAAGHDIGSRASGRKDRELKSGYGYNERVNDQITEALDPERPAGSHTEFVVADPKVSGLFFRLDSEGKLDDIQKGSDAILGDVVKKAQERNLPLFALHNGKFYSLSPDEALALTDPGITFDLREDRILSPEQMAELHSEMEEKQKEEVVEKFMGDSPFQLNRFPEAYQVEMRAGGRSAYWLFREKGDPMVPANESTAQKIIIPSGTIGNIKPMKATILKTIPGVADLKHYVEFEDGEKAIWSKSWNPVTERSRIWIGAEYSQDHLYSKTNFLPSEFHIDAQDEDAKNIKGLIKRGQKAIQFFRSWMEKFRERGDNLGAQSQEQRLKRLAAFFNGLAEEARGAGDNETADLAQNLVVEIFPEDEYRAMIERRVSETGTFKISKEELFS